MLITHHNFKAVYANILPLLGLTTCSNIWTIFLLGQAYMSKPHTSKLNGMMVVFIKFIVTENLQPNPHVHLASVFA